MKRKIAAILAADVAGYSRLVADDEEDTLNRLESYRRVFEDFVNRAGGRVFNTAGDSVLAEFSSAVEATRCAIDIQESLRTRNLGYPPSRQMLFRIGLTIGDVVERDGDLLGDGVNIAARLEGLAPAGGICVSRTVYEQVANKLSVPFRDMGQQDVKNIPQPVHAFMIEMHGNVLKDRERTARQSVLDRQNAGQRGVNPAMAAGLALLLAGTGAAGYFGWRQMQPGLVRPDDTPKIATASPSDRNKPPQPPQPEPSISQMEAAGQQAASLRQAALPVKPPVADPAPAPPSQVPSQQVPSQQGPSQQGPSQQGPSQQGRPAIPDGATPAQVFALLGKAGGIVQDAAAPPELYHNARVWEARGQAAEARRAYSRLAALGIEAIDAHMRFAAILRAQDGRAGAREIYAALAAGKGGRAAALVHALQFNGAERRAKVIAFAAAQPAYAPAQMLAAREYSADRLGSQTLDDKRRQLAALKNFLQAEDNGALPRFFMDHSVLAEWIDEARKSHAVLEKYFKTAVLKPVISYMRSNQGWMGNISLPEASTAISVRIGESGDFKPTGAYPHIDQRTGRPMANPSFELPANAPATTVHVRYRDANDIEQGPFALRFDPNAALVSGQKDILERFSNGWIAFGKEDFQRGLLYFTHLVSYRCAISRATIAFDDGPFDQDLPIPPCDMADPHATPRDFLPFLRIAPSIKSVRVQITYADGTKSEPKTFVRSP